MDFLKAKAKEVFPEGYTYDFQGESRQLMQEGSTLTITFIFSLIIIFLVLAAQFESFRDPFVILIALPTAMFGALLPLNMLGVMGMASINIYTQIGLVTLIGLISKHGILMTEFANRMQEEQGMTPARGDRTCGRRAAAADPDDDGRDGCRHGARSSLAEGAGAKSRTAIGMVIAFGMFIGTLFTLFVTPAIYTFIARDHRAGREHGEEPAMLPVNAQPAHAAE